MKDFRLILAGSAAVLLPVAAQAADLPSTKSAPVQFVRICDAYGNGFFYIPGTQTCLKIGGRVRFELSTQSISNVYRHASVGGQTSVKGAPYTDNNAFVNKNGLDSLSWLARGYLFVDARTQSAWGTVQTVMTLRINSTSGFLNSNYTAAVGAATNAFAPTLDAAYVRFAGFTFGRAASNFTTMAPLMYNTDYWGGFAAGIKQLAYTATFGGGFSATLALEDRQDMTSMVTANALGPNGCAAPCVPIAALASAVGPSRLPNLVGNLRVDQAWGWAQLSGAVGQNTANFTTPAALANVNNNGVLVKKTGWAIAASARINLPMIAAGDNLQITAGYANGMLDMIVGAGLNGNVPKNGTYMGGLLRFDRSMTIFECGPANAIVACSETTKGWNVGGQFTHYWLPTVRQTIAASYIRITPGTVTQRTDWQQGGLSKASAWTVGTNLTWSPVQGFDIGLELTYARLKQNLTGLNGAAPSLVNVAAACVGGIGGGGVAAGVCGGNPLNFKVSPNVWNARLRVERNF